jgi:SHS family lactate transporter-like MFS transporter
MEIAGFTGWTREQRSVVIASFLGWTLDAFDFFLLVFVLKDIAQEFNTATPRSPRSPSPSCSRS